MTATLRGHCPVNGLSDRRRNTDIRGDGLFPWWACVSWPGLVRDRCVLTCRPTSLLCWFMVLAVNPPLMADAFLTSLSMNLRLNQVPYWMWSEQPPQCQPSSDGPPPRRRPAQPHSVMLPWLQERVTAWTSPAAITA